ncbi:hypothetical protein C8J36_105104 [Rhizobium sp. PP-F2F-G48]|nr:hypothetical protein C8J36_105104 [Rhizobium sp. PP-F2F-G48]
MRSIAINPFGNRTPSLVFTLRRSTAEVASFPVAPRLQIRDFGKQVPLTVGKFSTIVRSIDNTDLSSVIIKHEGRREEIVGGDAPSMREGGDVMNRTVIPFRDRTLRRRTVLPASHRSRDDRPQR